MCTSLLSEMWVLKFCGVLGVLSTWVNIIPCLLLNVYRYSVFRDVLDELERKEFGGLDGFTRSYVNCGVHVRPDGSVVWQEWCPAAQDLRLYGEFSMLFWVLSIENIVLCMIIVFSCCSLTEILTNWLLDMSPYLVCRRYDNRTNSFVSY